MKPREVGAMILSVKIGLDLQKNHPELADIYRCGHTLDQIAEQLNVRLHYNVSSSVASTAVRRALRGYYERMHGNYDGLLEDSEADKIAHDRKQQNGKRENKSKIGCFAITPKERQKIGERMRHDGKGLYGLTHEEHVRSGRSSAISRGLAPWSTREKKTAETLSKRSEYRQGSKVLSSRIAEELNRRYHYGAEVRTGYAVKFKLRRLHGLLT